MPQQLIRLTDIDAYALVDRELVLVVSPATSYGSVELFGSAIRTRDSGWRCLRWGLVDIGYRPDARTAVELIVTDSKQVGRPKTIAAAHHAVEPSGCDLPRRQS